MILPVVLQQVTINLISLFRSESTKYEFLALLESFYFVNLGGTWTGLYGDVDSQTCFIWILGEFCNPKNFENEKLEESLGMFEEISDAESFKLEGNEFQSELVLAALKIFIQNGLNCENLLRKVLRRGIEEGESVDLRDRCNIYERILNHEIGRLKCSAESASGASVKAVEIGIDDWTNKSEEYENGVSLYESVLEGLIDDLVIEESGSGDEPKGSLKPLLNQLTTLSSIYHQLPSEFVSSRAIIKDCSETSGMSPLEQSIQSISLENSSTTGIDTGDMPRAWTKLLRHNRPAVANLLDMEYTKGDAIAGDIAESLANGKTSKSPSTPKEKYANLLDLLD